jgi:hypothetical protein
MTDNLHELLEGDEPVALRRIEKALHSGEVENETVETVVSALIWRRCTSGPNGVLGAVLNQDCAARLDVLPEHLDSIGATDAAQAVRDLRANIPLEDEQIRHGLIDWVDTNPEIAKHAKALDDDFDDVTQKVWSFMQESQNELPDPEIPDKKTGLFSRLFGG